MAPAALVHIPAVPVKRTCVVACPGQGLEEIRRVEGLGLGQVIGSIRGLEVVPAGSECQEECRRTKEPKLPVHQRVCHCVQIYRFTPWEDDGGAACSGLGDMAVPGTVLVLDV